MSDKRDKKMEEKLPVTKWNKYSWDVIPLAEIDRGAVEACQKQFEAIDKADQEREIFPVTPVWKTSTG